MYAGDFSSYMRIKPEILPGVWGEVQRSRPTLSRDLLYWAPVRSEGMGGAEQLWRR